MTMFHKGIYQTFTDGSGWEFKCFPLREKLVIQIGKLILSARRVGLG